MSFEILLVFATVLTAAVLFASNRVRLDVVAILVVLVLMLSGVLTPREALAGFGDPVVILVAGLLVIGDMLDRTSVAKSIGSWIMQRGGGSETKLIILLMLAAALLSSVMSSTAVVAIFIPVIFKITAGTKVQASRVLLPMSLAAMIGGMLTLIATTPNLVVSSELAASGYQPLGFFSSFPIGAAVLTAGIVYMLTIGRRLMHSDTDSLQQPRERSLRDLWLGFGLDERIQRVRVTSTSPLVDKKLGDAQIRTLHDVYVLGLQSPRRYRNSDATEGATASEVIHADTTLIISGRPQKLAQFIEANQLEVLPDEQRDRHALLQEFGAGVAMVLPDCKYRGKTIREASFRSRYGVHVLGIRRGNQLLPHFEDVRLATADTLLVAGAWDRLGQLRTDKYDFILIELPSEFREARPAHRKAPLAIAILIGMVLLSILNVVPMVAAVMIAALLAVITKCVTMEDSYRAISWSSLVLLAGMLPVADALQKTGGTALIVETVTSSLGSSSPYAMMTILFFMTAGLSLFLSNTASAVLLGPVAIQTAAALDVSPYPLAMTILIGASSAFASPVASPVVTLVVEPGRYTFLDFVRVGGPLVLIAYLINMLLTPLLFPF